MSTNTNSHIKKQSVPSTSTATLVSQNYHVSTSHHHYTTSVAGNNKSLSVPQNKILSASQNKSSSLSHTKSSSSLQSKHLSVPQTNKNTALDKSNNLKSRSNAVGINQKATTASSNVSGTSKAASNEEVVAPSLTAAALAEKNKDDNLQRLSDTQNKVIKHYTNILDDLKANFQETLTQIFFIQSGGNMVDYPSWKMRPTPHLLSYLTSQWLDDSKIIFPAVSSSTTKTETTVTTKKSLSLEKSIKQEPIDSSSLHLEQYGFVQGSHISHNSKEKREKHVDSKAGIRTDTETKSSLNLNIQSSQRSSSTSGNITDIAGQVRHESETLHRIAELRKNGLWSASRLPKVFEIPRKKSHWDFLLEEMQWLATDFSQEKRWKRNTAKKVIYVCVAIHSENSLNVNIIRFYTSI